MIRRNLLDVERLDDRVVPSLLTTLIDTATDGTAGFGSSPVVSGDGRFVAFETTGSLVPADGNGLTDVYLKDLATGALTLISVNTLGNAVGGSRPAVSADGRYVVFQSAFNIAGGSAATDIFRRDTATNTTALVSVGETTNCAAASVSDDGTRVAFERSYASPLWGYRFYPHIVGETIVRDVVVRDIRADTTTVVSPPHQDDNPGYQGPFSIPYVDVGYRDSYGPHVSGDGSTVVFASTSRAAGPSPRGTDIHHVWLPTLAVTRLNAVPLTNGLDGYATVHVSVNRDGRFVAFDTPSDVPAGGNPGVSDVFVWDTADGGVTLMSASATGAAGNGASDTPAISGDGRFVAFTSISSNLVVDDTGGTEGMDVFVKDRVIGAVTRASSSVTGGTANGTSWGASLNRDGRVVAFESRATNLVGGTVSGDPPHVYARQLPLPAAFAAAPDAGGPSLVPVFYPDPTRGGGSGPEVYPGFTGGTTVALGDVTGDGIADVVAGPGAGGTANVRVLDGATRGLTASFLAYDAGFTGGVNVAVGDVDNDGYADIVTGPGTGGGPNVRVFSGKDRSLLVSFYAYQTGFTGGVRVAVGDVNGDGYCDVVTVPGAGGGPNVRVFDGRQLALGNTSLGDLASGGALLHSFYASPGAYADGLFVTAGDVTNDGFADILIGYETGGTNVRGYDARTGEAIFSTYAFAPTQTGGVRVAATDWNQDGFDDIVAGTGAGTPNRVVVISGKDRTTRLYDEFSPFLRYRYSFGSDRGVNVG